jgi:hypothetical protein
MYATKQGNTHSQLLLREACRDDEAGPPSLRLTRAELHNASCDGPDDEAREKPRWYAERVPAR